MLQLTISDRQHQLTVLLPLKNVEQSYCMTVNSFGASFGQDV